MTEFVNPYSFVSFGDSSPDGQEPPLGRDRARETGISGTIEVTFKVATPLLILDDSTKTRVAGTDDSPHYLFRTRHDASGSISIPLTGIKGPLRAAYEAVTDSRMGVFEDHSRRLGYRIKASKGAGLTPVRVSHHADPEYLELLEGMHDDPRRSGRDARLFTQAAFVGVDGVASLAGVNLRGGKLDSRQLKKYLALDGLKVTATVDPFRHFDRNGRETFVGWRASSLRIEGQDVSEAVNVASLDTQKWRPDRELKSREIVGYLSVSGPNTARGKHEERIFFSSAPEGPRKVELTGEIRELWEDVMVSYRRANDLKPEGTRSTPNAAQPGLTPAAHLLDRERRSLTPGRTALVRLDRNDPEKVIEIHPVAIGRGLRKLPPRQFVPDHVLPIQNRNEASPADRLFGFVAASKTSSQIDQAAKGQLRLHHIDTQKLRTGSPSNDGQPQPLEVLGSPKEGQHAFYLGIRDGSSTKPWRFGGSPAGYSDPMTQRLRGRKVFWHHQVKGDWRDRKSWRRAEVRTGGAVTPADHRDGQNRSIAEWIEVGGEFTVTIHVSDALFSDVAPFVWLLRQAMTDDPAHLRFGYGKPLGFGSCSVSDLQLNFEPSASRYDEWRPQVTRSEAPAQVGCLAKELEEFSFGEDTPALVVEYLTVARGTEAPVMYPRTGASEPGYTWFVANDRAEERAQPLPAPENPLLSISAAPTNQNRRRRR
jgi:CRISPR-associated protein (TIGR03986 family)